MVFPRTRTIRVLIDSTVLMAASISSTGAGRELIFQGIRGQVQLFISSLVLQETERNLYNKAPQGLGDFNEFKLILSTDLVDPTKASVIEVSKTVAAKDAPIVAAARQARADYLASYDQKHLLSQRQIIQAEFGIQAVFPDEVLKDVRSRG